MILVILNFQYQLRQTTDTDQGFGNSSNTVGFNIYLYSSFSSFLLVMLNDLFTRIDWLLWLLRKLMLTE